MAQRLLSVPPVMELAMRPTLNHGPTPVLRTRSAAGVTILEMIVVVAMIGIMAAVAVPRMTQWRQDNQIRDAARQIADGLLLARAEAIRTGNRHVVFLGMAPSLLNPQPVDPRGGPIPMLVINDGVAGVSNCGYDFNDEVHTVFAQPAPGVNWGQAAGLSLGNAAPNDNVGDLVPIDGSSFVDGAGGPAQTTWVMFRADGIPVGFTPGCVVGPPGSGTGAVYLSNGRRDYAVVLTTLGGVRVHSWDTSIGQWRL